jgi:hypothetical protein
MWLNRQSAVALLGLLLAGRGTTLCWAGVRVAQASVQLGEVRAGTQVTHVFELVNEGPASAEILEVRGSCGCLTPQVEPRIISPHGTAKLQLSMNTLGQGAGPHSWTARVHYRTEGKEHDLAAVVSARVITEVIVQPAALTIVGTGAMTQMVTVTDLRVKAFTITALETSTPGLRARMLGQGRDRAGDCTTRIQLDVAADLKAGRHVEALSLYTNDADYRCLRIPVTIIKQSAASAVAIPDEVTLRPRPGQGASCLVRVHTPGVEAVRISAAESGNPALTCIWVAGPGHDATLRIQLDPARWTGSDLDATVRVHLDTPAREVLPVHVQVRAGSSN